MLLKYQTLLFRLINTLRDTLRVLLLKKKKSHFVVTQITRRRPKRRRRSRPLQIQVPKLLIFFLVCFFSYSKIKKKITLFIINIHSFFKLQFMKIKFFFMKKFSDYPLFRVFFENYMNKPPFKFNTVEEAIDYFKNYKTELFIVLFFFSLFFSFFFYGLLFWLIECVVEGRIPITLIWFLVCLVIYYYYK